MGVGARIKEARLRLGLTQKQLADAIGVSGGAIGNYENETSSPREPILYALLDALGVEPNFLFQDEVKKPNSVTTLTPQGQKIGRAYEKAPEREQGLVEHVLEPYMETSVELAPELPEDNGETEMTEAKIYTEAAAAGFGNYLSDDESYEMIPFPANEVPARADFGIRISGDSMEPTIEDGSIAWVEAMPSVESGDIGIFILNGDAYCKELSVEITDGRRSVSLLSHNENYDDIEINEGDELRTVGKVLP